MYKQSPTCIKLYLKSDVPKQNNRQNVWSLAQIRRRWPHDELTKRKKAPGRPPKPRETFERNGHSILHYFVVDAVSS